MAFSWLRVFKDTTFSRYLWEFPLVAGVAWFITLTILLIRWLSLGLPRYPGQVNPDVPFISDIAAFTFKPVFIAGCTVTGVAFAGTVFAVHHVRYSPKFYGLTNDVEWRQSLSLVSLLTGLAAALCLFFLSVFDTVDAHDLHASLLLATLGGLSLSALTTVAVWWDQTWGPPAFAGLRKWCLVNTWLMFCEVVVGAALVIWMYSGYFKPAGFCEWILTYLGSFWLLSFIGFTKFREGVDPIPASEEERQPLIASSHA